MEQKRSHPIWAALAVLTAIVEYVWGFWYFSGLQQNDALLSIKAMHAVELASALWQHTLVNLPVIILLVLFAAAYRRNLLNVLGLTCKAKKGRIAVMAVAAVYLFSLVLGLIVGKPMVFNILYGWFYYLIFIALSEELVFRAMLPHMMTKSGLPQWCVWVVPAVLFALMHTLVPLVTQGFAAGLQTLAYSCLGLAVSGCGFYALYRWSNTLWLPILVHATLDYLSLLI